MRTHHIVIGCTLAAAGAAFAILHGSSDPSQGLAVRTAPEAGSAESLAPPDPPAGRVPASAAPQPTGTTGSDPTTNSAPPPAPLGFDEAFERIVDLYVATSSGVSSIEKAVFEMEATRLYRDACAASELGERFVGRLHLLVPDEPGPREEAGFVAAQHGLRIAIERMRDGRLGEASDIPGLVSSIIELIPRSAAHAEKAATVIVTNRAVHPSHEGRLLELAQEAHGDLAFMSRPVIRLLALLWDGDGGAPSIDELIALTGSEGCAAEVALLELYAMEEMRDLIAAKAVEAFGTNRLWMFCQMGSQTLDAETSCDLLSRVSGHGHDVIFSSAYHLLETSGRGSLTESYAMNAEREDQAFHRAGIVSAVGAAGDEDGAEFAVAAFRSDPSPRVRSIAVQALGRQGGQRFQDVFEQAIADEALLGPSEAKILLSALRNYANGLDVDTDYLASATLALTSLVPSTAAMVTW